MLCARVCKVIHYNMHVDTAYVANWRVIQCVCDQGVCDQFVYDHRVCDPCVKNEYATNVHMTRESNTMCMSCRSDVHIFVEPYTMCM